MFIIILQEDRKKCQYGSVQAQFSVSGLCRRRQQLQQAALQEQEQLRLPRVAAVRQLHVGEAAAAGGPRQVQEEEQAGPTRVHGRVGVGAGPALFNPSVQVAIDLRR